MADRENVTNDQLFSVAGRLARSARQAGLHLNHTGRWTDPLLTITTLRSLPAPAS